jgi:hypothetical protein
MCRQPGCSSEGIPCDTTPSGCCDGKVCIAGTCVAYISCLIPGSQPCRNPTECCSGLCSGIPGFCY